MSEPTGTGSAVGTDGSSRGSGESAPAPEPPAPGVPTPAGVVRALGRKVAAVGSPILGGLVALLAVGYFIEALHYPRGSGGAPGPGLFPQVVAVALFVAAVGTVVTTRRPERTPVRDEEDAGDGHPLRPVSIVVAAVLFVGTLPSVGFFFAAALSLVVTELGMGVRNVFRVALFALVLAVTAQWLFVDVLGLHFFTTVHVLGG